MKEWSRKKVLKGKKSQYDPSYPSRSPGGQQDQGYGVVLQDQGSNFYTKHFWGIVKKIKVAKN